MNLYLVERKDKDVGYEEQIACVVAARSPRAARKIAQDNRGDEGEDLWMSTEHVRCSVLAKNIKRNQGLVLSSHSGA